MLSINDEFSFKDEGTSIKWSWNKLSLPHSIYEAEYCDTHGGLYRTSQEYLILNKYLSLKLCDILLL